MNTYLHRLISVMIICQTITLITPDTEYAKRYIRIVCALITVLTMLSPVRFITEISETFREFAASVISDTETSASEQTPAGTKELLQYISAHYNIEDFSAVFHTDETDTILTSLELHIKYFPYTQCIALQEELETLLQIPVSVNSK